jgi:hypothetical protein
MAIGGILQGMDRDSQPESGVNASPQPVNLDAGAMSMGVDWLGRKRFRWRVIPATLFALFGIASLIALTFHLALIVKLLIESVVSLPEASNAMAGDVVGILAATSLVLIARNLQKGRWLFAGMLLLVAAVLGQLAGVLGAGS